jgi:hypothetical protein
MPDITNAVEYAQYEAAIAAFIAREALTFISTGTNNGEDGDVNPWFSWRPCECCGSHLGGLREYLWAWSGETHVEFEICEDCAYYHNYGRLDDTTMLRVEDTSVNHTL